MEFEQIIHRLDWLDSEHRKDKKKMSALEERLASLETDLKVASKKIKEMNASLTRSSSAAARMEQMEDVLDQQRSEINKHINEVEKKWAGLQQEADKRYQLQTAGVEKTVLRKNREAINEIKRELKARSEEDVQRTRLLTEWESRMQAMVDASQEVDRAQKASAESQRQESKRLTDLQGEVSATRKRLDEVREKTDLFTDSIRRIESRLNELLAGEAGKQWRKEQLKVRGRIEAKFSEQMNQHGLRRARYWGQAKVTVQVLLNVITVNLKRAVKLMRARAAPPLTLAAAAAAM